MPDKSKKEKKRDKIILAANEIFSLDGYSNAKIEDIAKAADIGKGTIYEYFNSKDELFLSVFNVFKENVLSRYWIILELEVGPIEKLNRFAQITAESHFDPDLNMNILIQFRSECLNRTTDSAYKNILREYYDEIGALVTKLIGEGIEDGLLKPIDKELLSQNYIAALDGLTTQYLLKDKDFDIQIAAESIFEIFTKGTSTFAGRYSNLKEN